MRVRVDANKCEGHNRCFALAPDLFEIDEYGNAKALNDGVLSRDEEAKAVLAAENCPEFAIEILDGNAGGKQ
jgi:ferredoxin